MYDKNQNNNKSKKECCYEREFEEYIKKLNLGDVNIDRELFERPLFYNRRKKKNSNKNYFRTNDSKISPDSLEKKNSSDISNYKKRKNYSLRNSIKKNNKYNNKKLYQQNKGEFEQKNLILILIIKEKIKIK